MERHSRSQRSEVLASGRVHLVDSLRGLAALSVALFHFCLGSPGFYVPPIPKSIGGIGFHGVDVSFVISGFVLPYSLCRGGYRLTFTSFRRFVWKGRAD